MNEIKVLKMKEIVHDMKKGIIYVSTRKRVDLVLKLLRDWGVDKCEGYHAGMSDTKRDQAQVRGVATLFSFHFLSFLFYNPFSCVHLGEIYVRRMRRDGRHQCFRDGH
jgi:hypothetical protein